jgi:hypothetical protein
VLNKHNAFLRVQLRFIHFVKWIRNHCFDNIDLYVKSWNISEIGFVKSNAIILVPFKQRSNVR